MEDEQKKSVMPYFLAIAAAALAAICVLLYQENRLLEKEIAENARIAELQQYVQENFYTDVDEDAAMDGALKGYVEGLGDPYSVFLTPEEYGDWQEMESGTSVGIGVTVQASGEDGMLVIEVNADSPAERYGIQVDDVIIAVDGKLVSELGFEDAVAAVKGEANTEVILTVRRGDEELDCTVVRGEIATVTAFGKMLEGNVGYIRISAFRDNTDDQFKEAVDLLLKDGAEALIFDVRNNGGGLLYALEDTLDSLLPEGVIAVANYGNGEVNNIVESDAEELDIPMAVLINGSTASAGELFAASLHDFDKAFLVGTTTFGKGVMQDTRTVSGGAVTLTVATYQTVRGECYHGVGVTPDYEQELSEDYVLDFNRPDLESDVQLRTAYEKITQK